ncbi:hypothetical protein WJX73_009515 [Symbiochloris irregularis]|uniref:Thiol-disulfide oxidoreductase DCC n=1 Tax=Symbiochloris irregularis TaxID=706552 RepID=A0AAW1PSF8_9CHLO
MRSARAPLFESAHRAPFGFQAIPMSVSQQAHSSSLEQKNCSTQTHFARAVHVSATQSSAAPAASLQTGGQPSWTIEMLYDGDCPLCMREVNSLRNAPRADNINFVDIASDSYNPAEHADISYEEAMGKIHAIRRDGGIVTNVEAFKQLYEAAGRGWVYSFARIGPLKSAAEWVYNVWAKYRMEITGRGSMNAVMSQKKTCR